MHNSNVTTLLIEEPAEFYCELDESNFYGSLKALRSINEFYIAESKTRLGDANKIALVVVGEFLSDEDLRNLLGVLKRYGLPMSALASQCNSRNESWFRDSRQYWYSDVFTSD